MQIQPDILIMPLIALGTLILGRTFTSSGMEWYKTIALPSFTPPGWFIGLVWQTIYIMTTISAVMVWRTGLRDTRFWTIISLFVVNVGLNVLWTYLFFNQHMIGTAAIDALLLSASVYALIVLIYPISRTAALLLVPYALWSSFATYLNYVIWTMNR